MFWSTLILKGYGNTLKSWSNKAGDLEREEVGTTLLCARPFSNQEHLNTVGAGSLARSRFATPPPSPAPPRTLVHVVRPGPVHGDEAAGATSAHGQQDTGNRVVTTMEDVLWAVVRDYKEGRRTAFQLLQWVRCDLSYVYFQPPLLVGHLGPLPVWVGSSTERYVHYRQEEGREQRGMPKYVKLFLRNSWSCTDNHVTARCAPSSCGVLVTTRTWFITPFPTTGILNDTMNNDFAMAANGFIENLRV